MSDLVPGGPLAHWHEERGREAFEGKLQVQRPGLRGPSPQQEIPRSAPTGEAEKGGERGHFILRENLTFKVY